MTKPAIGPTTEPFWMRCLLISIAVGFVSVFLFLPLVVIFYQGLAQGIQVYLDSLRDKHALAALKLTLFTTAIVVPLNVVFGVIAAWCITKFDFYGKSILVTLIDLPFAISPVIAGLLFIILFGADSFLYSTLQSWNVRILFAWPGVVIATLFVTFPFVARELIPMMQSQGSEEEQAARVLGARGWQIFWRVTLPNIKWGLLYGVILCNARAMGEFGAVSVVAGNYMGKTNTLPLHIDAVYFGYPSTAAFACASLLAVLAMLTLVAKNIVESRVNRKTNEKR